MVRSSFRWPRLVALLVFLLAVGAVGYWFFVWLTTVQPTRANLAYAAKSERNVLDLYLPEGATGPVPVVVWVHGGAFMMGDKSGPQSLAALNEAGYAVAAINYRLSGTDQWPAQLEDVEAAVAYLRANASDLGIDPAKVALFGASAGGHLVSTTGIALAADPATAVQAVVDWFGPVDFTMMDSDIEETGLTRSTGRNDAADSPESALIGMSVADNPKEAQKVSPLWYLAQLPEGTVLPAFLVMHGGVDTFVGPKQSERLRDALLAWPSNGGVTYEFLPEGGHGSGAFQEAPATQKVVDFLDSVLK
ncbi:MAG: alpha/beta hydrolase [Rhodobacterales bacterium]|nr:alpha/beta hydrolase [Rhodobacterales bacterium]